jgi:hypothetical protein
MSMPLRIFVTCGGTNPANGFYTNHVLDEFYNEKDPNYSISYSNGYWNLYYGTVSPVVYYRLPAASAAVDPTNDTSWQVVNGTSPTIKSFNADSYNTIDSYSNYVFGTIVVAGADIANANGTYTRTESGIWTHSNSLYRIAIFASSRYAIYNIATNTAIYQCDSGSVNFHPVTIYDRDSLWYVLSGGGGTTAPTSSYYNTTTICSGGGAVTPTPTATVAITPAVTPTPSSTPGGGGASAPVMKILMKSVPVVVIEYATSYPQVNGIYYLVANPSNVYDSFFSKDGGDSYPRIIFDFQTFDNGYPPYFIKINSNDNEVYRGTGEYPQGWPGVGDFGEANWYYANGNDADITSSTSTANRPHIYKTGNIGYGRT